MATNIKQPTIIKAAGNKPKLIEEFIGRVNSNTAKISIARMTSPQSWEEPGQQPEFDEFTVVLRGMLLVRTETQDFEIRTGEAIIVNKGEWVQYSTPGKEGAEYIAVCLPAFSPELVHRDEDQ